jgi:Zn finger protein HypA/HybF involved in hydrogenase expression
MNLDVPPQIRCPACLRMVTFDHVEIIGEAVVLGCPHCAGVRIDLALEQVLARN